MSLNLLPRLKDNYKECGPAGGLEALLSSEQASHYLVCPCDVPKVQGHLLELLLKEERKNFPLVLGYEDKIEPLLGIYPASILSLVREHITKKDFAMHHILEAAGARIIEVPQEYREELKNVNTSKDIPS